MTPTAPDLAELRRLAESATPGPWEAFGAVDGRRGERWLGVTTDMRATEAARAGDVFAAQNCTRQDALFIAAANPAVVLALLDERDALAAKVERVRTVGDLTARHIGRRVRVETNRTLPNRVRLLSEIATASNEAVRLTLEVIDHPEWFLMASFTLDTPCELLP